MNAPLRLCAGVLAVAAISLAILLALLTVTPLRVLARPAGAELSAWPRLLLGLAVGGAACWLLLRHGWFAGDRTRFLGGRSLPASAPGPSWTARIAEAAALAAAGGAVLAMAATNRSTGGLLLSLDELRPEYARVNAIVFACAAAGALAAVLLALLWRTWAAVLLMAAVLAGYGLAINAASVPCGWFISPEAARPVIEKYTIRTTGSNLVGADLWVNGVHLGKTPVTTTLDEFRREVPHWPEPPAGFRGPTDVVKVPQYGSGGLWHANYHRWIEFALPRRPARHGGRQTRPADRQEGLKYYAQLRYGREEGLGDGSGVSYVGGDGLTYTGATLFAVIFPQRRARLEALLDQARLADYRVRAEWFKAIQTYDEDGWIALRTAADNEPAMMNVLDDWARWRYRLEQVKDADSAWAVFERIRAEAEDRQQYFTASLAGRALELIVPRLDPHRLVCLAERRIRAVGSYSWSAGRMNGRFQFGCTRRPEGFSGPSGGYSGTGYRRGEGIRLSDYPIAHAVWMLDELLDARDDTDRNLVERRITPALIRWHYDDGLGAAMRAALHLGGPDLERFLTRQDWRADPESNHLPWGERLSFRGRTVNGWLYLLASLDSPTGRHFRRNHAEAVMSLADKLYRDAFLPWNDDINFIFLDDWLAADYWPRFSKLARSRAREYALETQWRYLLRMGPAATADMYVQAWKATSPLTAHDDGLKVLDLLGPEKAQAVVAALIEQVQKDASNLKDESGFVSPDSVISVLRARAPGHEQTRRAKALFEQLRKGADDKRRRDVALWLEHTQPDSPLVEMLAAAADPALRRMVMGGLRSHPTPDRRRILQELLMDADPAVVAAAQQVQADLMILDSQDPMEYASMPPGKPQADAVPGQ